MDNKYTNLFIEMAKTSSVLAELVMEYNRKKNDENGEKNSEIMRDDFLALVDTITSGDLVRNDYIKLLVAAMIVRNNIQDKVKAYEKAINGYNIDIIPKLQRIVDETKTDEEAIALATELFTTKE